MNQQGAVSEVPKAPDCGWCGDRIETPHLGCAAGRIEALAEESFEFSRTLPAQGNETMRDVYIGKGLGLRQAAGMLRAELMR